MEIKTMKKAEAICTVLAAICCLASLVIFILKKKWSIPIFAVGVVLFVIATILEIKANKEKKKLGLEEEKASVAGELVGWLKTFAGAVIAAFLLSQFIVLSVTVPTGSMENTIMTGDRLIGFRFAYWFSEPERGDIVVFHSTVDDKDLIKRVIGLPGETVEISEGKIYIDGSSEPLDEPYLKEEWVFANDGYVFEIPEGCYLVMGDNRNNSLDARFWAQVALQTGKAKTEEEAEALQYVPEDAIMGKAVLKYYRSFGKLE